MSKKVFVGGIKGIPKEDLRTFFEDHVGDIAHFQVKPNGYAFIEFKQAGDADIAIRDYHKHKFGDCILDVQPQHESRRSYPRDDYSRGRFDNRQYTHGRQGAPDRSTVSFASRRPRLSSYAVIENLPATADWRSLKTWALRFVRVQFVQVNPHNDMGLLGFDNHSECLRAIDQLHDSTYEGATVRMYEDVRGTQRRGTQRRGPRDDGRDRRGSDRRDYRQSSYRPREYTKPYSQQPYGQQPQPQPRDDYRDDSGYAPPASDTLGSKRGASPLHDEDVLPPTKQTGRHREDME
eukprot:gnl/Dysnectes_brevis/1321_a1483_1943.p1 GENE.gnl/Dysnectes_brevis/1321_a1483_1943~~gnl/Dysnectes_brevis/1321_a1483_1943.p1  ORF type:complete len:292 (+),score=65.62 gnl/Dysnectes_brevis/1321_a1483_1943:63-938(+)